MQDLGLDKHFDFLYDDDSCSPQPLITSTTAISFLNELGHYLQALSVATLPAVLQKSLTEYVEANKKQNT